VSNQIVCDGCGVVLQTPSVLNPPPAGTELVITGERSNNLRGGGLPSDTFHWCLRCAQVAFRAVEDAKLRRAGLVRG
jgi:hypothetical protein